MRWGWMSSRQRRWWPTRKRRRFLTWLDACRILERKGTMAHSTDRNQKMKRTPEDWTPRNLSNWIRNVASSWERRGGGVLHGEGKKEWGGRGRDWVRLAGTESLRACKVNHSLTGSDFHADCSPIKHQAQPGVYGFSFALRWTTDKYTALTGCFSLTIAVLLIKGHQKILECVWQEIMRQDKCVTNLFYILVISRFVHTGKVTKLSQTRHTVYCMLPYDYGCAIYGGNGPTHSWKK